MVPPARGAWRRRGRLCSCDPPWQRPASVNKPIPQHARLGCIYVNLGWGTSERIINTARPLPWKGGQLALPSHPQSLALSLSASSPRSAVYTQERGGEQNNTTGPPQTMGPRPMSSTSLVGDNLAEGDSLLLPVEYAE